MIQGVFGEEEIERGITMRYRDVQLRMSRSYRGYVVVHGREKGRAYD